MSPAARLRRRRSRTCTRRRVQDERRAEEHAGAARSAIRGAAALRSGWTKASAEAEMTPSVKRGRESPFGSSGRRSTSPKLLVLNTGTGRRGWTSTPLVQAGARRLGPRPGGGSRSSRSGRVERDGFDAVGELEPRRRRLGRLEPDSDDELLYRPSVSALLRGLLRSARVFTGVAVRAFGAPARASPRTRPARTPSRRAASSNAKTFFEEAGVRRALGAEQEARDHVVIGGPDARARDVAPRVASAGAARSRSWSSRTNRSRWSMTRTAFP